MTATCGGAGREDVCGGVCPSLTFSEYRAHTRRTLTTFTGRCVWQRAGQGLPHAGCGKGCKERTALWPALPVAKLCVPGTGTLAC